ncbi:hypothetical protein BBJ28_00021506 [Nothophytophthora sp. Chile5]|nr:hypothetical protein BBJ28_00021506 [Nothophytophthora sp. Chile5]
MRPNFSSLLPKYANAEAEHIRGAFVAGTYGRIQRLPAKITASAVNQARFEQMDENRLAQAKTGSPATRNGLFTPFEYAPSRFSLADELDHLARLQADAKRMEISGQKFVGGSDAARLKHEDAFGTPDFSYPHLTEPYPDTSDEDRHRRWVEAKKMLHGAFVPSGRRPPVDAVTRKLLPQMLQELQQVLAADWQDVEFAVSPAEDGSVVVRFNEASIENERGLAKYMNVFCKSHRVPAKYGLHKVAEDWNAKPGDGGLYFVFRPPWVKNRSKDLIVFVNRSATDTPAPSK